MPPLTAEEYEQLEENIIAEGEVLMPIIVWDGVIIEGHNRYKIAEAHPGVKYSTRNKPFPNRCHSEAFFTEKSYLLTGI